MSGLLAAGLLLAAEPSYAQRVATQAPSGASYEARLAAYTRARNAYEAEASAYWDQIAEKRRTRFAKRRNNQPVGLDDYVLTQPPVYTGPPKPPGPRRARCHEAAARANSGGRRFSQSRRRSLSLRAAAARQRPRFQARLCQGREGRRA